MVRVSFYSDIMEIGKDVNVPDSVVDTIQSMWDACSPEVRAIFGFSFNQFMKMVFQANYIECGDAWTIKCRE